MKLAGNYVILVLFIIYISGCAIGRSWDSPEISNTQISINAPKDIIIYSRNNSHLIRTALAHKQSKKEAVPFIVEELDASEEGKYPIIIVKTQKPKYSDSLLSYSFGLSFLTLSIIPGYTNESSSITLELRLKDDMDKVVSKTKTYIATRHFFNWLPLLPFANYGGIVIDEWGASNTDSFWDEAYGYYIRQFVLEEKNSIIKHK